MATNNIEIEAKVLVSKEDYEKLLQAFPVEKQTVVQTNYYLDSNDRILKKYGMILRIRHVGNNYTLTMKAPLAEGLLEKNQRLTDAEFNSLFHDNIFPKGEVFDFLDVLHIKPRDLHILAHLTTERKETEFKDTIVDISKNTYSGRVDYELECDSDSAAKSERTLKEICVKFAIPFILNTLSKETRAINAATDLNK